ncbi:NUDIX hydrolase [Nonomuraea wenchangensis]|uniref:NUDIX hydrolase n=1 Tax=Nonomuraea wenchangensis TaxID=568860 RepID=UPI003435D59F
MPSLNLRHAVRAIVLDDHDRILLCRLALPKPAGTTIVWAAPGGGVEPGETPLAALRRELDEEVGLAVEELAAEHIDGFRWWALQEIAGYRGPELFSPRDLATPLAGLLAGGPPARPVRLGL